MPRKPARGIRLDILVEAGAWPARQVLARLSRDAVDAALAEAGLAPSPQTELSVVFTDDEAVRVLNAGWRGKDKPTNVLSFSAFPYSSGDPVPPMLGDVVLAAETVAREAASESMPLEHHISHLLIHGILHLLGHDHEDEDEAETMEALERKALARLAIPDPYA